MDVLLLILAHAFGDNGRKEGNVNILSEKGLRCFEEISRSLDGNGTDDGIDTGGHLEGSGLELMDGTVLASRSLWKDSHGLAVSDVFRALKNCLDGVPGALPVDVYRVE